MALSHITFKKDGIELEMKQVIKMTRDIRIYMYSFSCDLTKLSGKRLVLLHKLRRNQRKDYVTQNCSSPVQSSLAPEVKDSPHTQVDSLHFISCIVGSFRPSSLPLRLARWSNWSQGAMHSLNSFHCPR